MITRNNSLNLMNRFAQAEADIKSLTDRLVAVQQNLEQKTAVINRSQQYNAWLLQQIQEHGAVTNSDKIVFANEDSILAGAYGIYGQTIHPRFLGFTDMFNFQTALGPVYKDTATVSINGETKAAFNDILKDDAVSGKQPVFTEYKENAVVLTVAMNSDSVMLDREFNVIELCPFLPGSFTITGITITQQDDTEYEYPGSIEKAGAMRICFPDKLKLKSVTFRIALSYQTDGGLFPFGFKHILFLNADYADSRVIVPVTKKAYIDYISEELVVHDQYGVHNDTADTCTKWGVKAYLYYNNKQLENEITPLYGANQSYINRNVKTIYVDIPIQTSLFSLEFKTIGLR